MKLKVITCYSIQISLLTFILCSSPVFTQTANEQWCNQHGVPLILRDAAASEQLAEIKFVEMRPGRPRLTYLFFDVVLRNDRKYAAWFLLPSNLGPGQPAIGEKGGVDTLEVFKPRGNGHVVIGHFLGTGGFNALLLPAHAEVRLRRFPISYWGELPNNLEIEVVNSRKLTIGGATAQSWFGKNPVSSLKADITEDAEDPRTASKSRSTADRKEVPVLFEADRRFQVRVSLEPPR